MDVLNLGWDRVKECNPTRVLSTTLDDSLNKKDISKINYCIKIDFLSTVF